MSAQLSARQERSFRRIDFKEVAAHLESVKKLPFGLGIVFFRPFSLTERNRRNPEFQTQKKNILAKPMYLHFFIVSLEVGINYFSAAKYF